MKNKTRSWITLIKRVAKENDYAVSRGVTTFTIRKDPLKHQTAFRVVLGSTEYLEVSQWKQEKPKRKAKNKSNDDGEYGLALYSLRSWTDAIHFCDILIASGQIRARRTEE